VKVVSVSALSPRLLTTAEAAVLLNVSKRTILNWIGRGSIPYVELPSGGERKEYRIPRAALLRSLSGNYDLAAELKALEVAAKAAAVDEEQLLDDLDGERKTPE
jgi:excisionase family DNA binding protein